MKMTLKGIRNNLDLTQDEMAEKLGISKDVYQNYETYRTYPNVPIIEKILKFTGLQYEDIIFLPKNYGNTVKSE